MDKQVAMYKLIEEWKRSGISRGLFAQQQKVKRPTFDYWYKKYTAELAQSSNELDFVEISHEPARHISEKLPRVVLEFSDGTHVKIY